MVIVEEMAQERIALEQAIATTKLEDKAAAVCFVESLIKLIWNHKMVGLIHTFYDHKPLFKGANGLKLVSQDEIVIETLEMLAAFPNLRMNITESFASGDKNSEFKVYLRSYCDGQNQGPSRFGPPTNNVLNEKNSLGQSVYILKKIGKNWKIKTEYSLRSQLTIEKLLTTNHLSTNHKG